MRERRMSKYIISIVLALAMVIGIAVFAIPTASADDPDIWDGSVADSFDGGDGSEGDPYQIATPAQWAYFAQCNNDVGGARETGKYYVLTADLYFNEGDASTWGSSAPANDLADHIVGPVCNSNPFVGTLDGQGHTISGVYINKTGGSCGLFGSTAAGKTTVIKNLIVTNSYYKSDSSGEAGALIGQLSGGTTHIENVFVTDSVYIKSAGTSDGGFVGHCGANGYGDPTLYIENSVNGATVDAGSNQYVGGFVGNGNGKQLYINNCLNYGSITGGSNYVAGIVGRDDKAGSEFNYCVNIGSLSGTVRQIVFSNTSSKKPILTNCLALTTSYGKNTTNNNCAQLTGKDAFLSAGFLDGAQGQKIANTWVELASVTQITGGTRTIKEICVPSALVTAIGADKIRTNLYSSVDAVPASQWILDAWNDGEVTITSTQEWKEFANFVNGVYEDKCTDNMNGKTVLLGDDLNFNGEDITNYIVGVTPATSFKGTFDGQGHTISGVYMKKVAADGDTVGLFGFTAAGEEATLQNLLITNSYFESEAGAVAALLAQTAGGETYINNIYVTDSVEIVSGDSYSGGIAAHNGANGFGNPQIYIDSCVNAATVTSTGSAAAGILGNGNGQVYTVSNCLNMGDITGSKSVGGIVGYGRANAGVEINIEACVNTGAITSASSTDAEKSCAIASFGGTARDTLTAYGCYYLTGTASYGVYENGEGEGATVVVISALLGEALPEGLEESGNWIARGDGTVFEICIPAGVEGFAPAETKYHMEDNTPDWLKDYADADEFAIDSVDQWKEFANFVNGAYTTGGDFEGKTIYLEADLDFENLDMSEYMVGSWKIPFAGTFDGQGHTITRFRVVKSSADTAAIFGSTAGGNVAIIKNLKVTASHFEAKGSVGAIVGQTSGGSTQIYNVYVDADVEIVSTDSYAGGLVGHIGQNGFDFIADTPALIIDSSVNAASVTATGKTSVGGILGNANNKNVTISNCLNMGNVIGGSNVGGIIGNGTGGTTTCEIYVDGCVNIGTITNTSGNVAAIANLSNSGTRTATNCYYLKGTATNGVVSGTDNDVQMVSFSKLGGEELPENLDGEKWIARGEGSVYEICIPAGVEDFAPATTSFHMEDNTPDWLIDYADTTEFTIDSVDQWKEFADFVNGKYTSMGNFEGKTVYLGADLDFEDQDMTDYVIGAHNAPFVGTFDGQGHTISGFRVEKTDADTAGIFGATAGGKTTIIRNLKVTASYFAAKGSVGAIVGQTSGGSTQIYNVYVDANVQIVATGNFAGGLVGHVGQNGFEFIDAHALIVDSCVNAATITATGRTCVGGILGNANNKSITITNCLNMGNVTGGSNVGGIVGNGTGNDDVEMTIDGCVNVGTITNASGNVAAIANLSESGTRTAVNCYYLIGTALNGVVSGTDNDVQAASLIVLGAEELPANLNEEKWTARGEGNVLEICVPSAVATYVPAETSFHAIDNTPDWLKGYEDTDEFSIETVEQWKELANFIKGEYVGVGNFDGKVVYLANDIDFTGEDMTEYMLGTMTIPFAGTFDGQGHTISGFHVEKTEGDTAGLFGSTAGGKTAIIKNFKITASYFEAAGAVGAIVGQTSGGSTELYNIYVDADVVINSTGSAAGGLVGHVGQNRFQFIEDTPALIVDSCVNAAEVTAEGKNSVGGILGNANQKDVTITNCLNIGAITGGTNVGGIVGYGLGNGTISIDACVNVGTITGSGAAIANFSTSGTKQATSCYCLIGTAANGVVGGTGTDVEAVSVMILGGATLPENLAASVDDDNNCKWIARGEGSILEICIPAAVEAYAPAETSFRTEDNTPEWLQNYATDEEFTIETVEQWKEFANFINGEYLTSGDFEGKTVKLGNDIDFDNEDMTDYMISKIASKDDGATPFAGTFDGQGYTISGFYVYKEDSDTAGIFGSTAGGKTAVIQNFKVSASHFEAAGAVGAVIGQTSGGSTEIYNVYVDADVEIVSTGDYTGGLVGHIGGNGFDFIEDTPALIVDSCVNAAEITTDSNNVGGILGNANNKNVTITNCLNMGNITGGTNVGGIIGKGDGGTTTCKIYIDACVNIGAINGTSKVAAITVLSDKGERTAVNCYYLIGTADKGVESGKDTDVQAVSFLVLGGAALPENLNNGYWVARGEGNELEICIPAGVAEIAPATTSFHAVDDTPEWLKGYAETDKFTITTVEQWKEIANFIKGEYMSSGDFEGKTVELGCEIDFANEDMTAYMLGSMATPFAGTFDGNGAAIIGFRVVVEGADTAGIFGSTAGGKLATIRNLVITDSYFEAKGAVGALIGQTSGGSTVIENVYVTSTVEIVSYGNYAGGLVGHVGQNGYSFIDGEPALSINACVNAAKVIGVVEKDDEGEYTFKSQDIGGILGNSNTKDVVVTNCLNVGDITGYRYVGGIVGLASDYITISYCINAGDINATSSKAYAAEIATGNVTIDNKGKSNEHYREVTISNCYYTDIKVPFVNQAAEEEKDEGTVILEDNTPYFAIPTVDWEGWTEVEGGLPTPFVIADVLTVSANIDRSVMVTGASVRMDTPTGIRFTAQFSKGFVDGLDDTAKIGILIVPKAYLDEAGEFTVDALVALSESIGRKTYVAVYNYKDAEGCFAKSTDEYYIFNAVLANIKAENYTRDFCARAFIELEDGTILYSDYNDTNNRRNVAAVAESAYNDTQKLDENEGVAGYMNFVEETIVKVTEKQFVGQDPDSGEDIYEDVEVEVTKYVYSPYTAEQRAILYNFFYKEPEEPAAE